MLWWQTLFVGNGKAWEVETIKAMYAEFIGSADNNGYVCRIHNEVIEMSASRLIKHDREMSLYLTIYITLAWWARAWYWSVSKAVKSGCRSTERVGCMALTAVQSSVDSSYTVFETLDHDNNDILITAILAKINWSTGVHVSLLHVLMRRNKRKS